LFRVFVIFGTAKIIPIYFLCKFFIPNFQKTFSRSLLKPGCKDKHFSSSLPNLLAFFIKKLNRLTQSAKCHHFTILTSKKNIPLLGVQIYTLSSSSQYIFCIFFHTYYIYGTPDIKSIFRMWLNNNGKYST
jgi:hypothetical protein